MTDNEIISLYFARSEEAITSTRKQYGKLIRHIILKILRNAEDTDECENDTYMSAWNTIPPKTPDNLKAYLAVIARNTAMKRYEYLHAEKRSPQMEVSFEELAECLCDDTAGQHTDVQLREAINGFLSTLKPEQRRIFLLRYWQGYSIEELMQISGFSKSKTESMLFRIRNKMRKYLVEGGYIHEQK